MKIEVKTKVYCLETIYTGWEDPEANGGSTRVFTDKAKARKELQRAVAEEISTAKDFDRLYDKVDDTEDFVRLVSSRGEYVEFSVMEREVE